MVYPGGSTCKRCLLVRLSDCTYCTNERSSDLVPSTGESERNVTFRGQDSRRSRSLCSRHASLIIQENLTSDFIFIEYSYGDSDLENKQQ